MTYILNKRELELLEGMIKVQENHSERCDHIENRRMAKKQKGWDIERIVLLKKLIVEHLEHGKYFTHEGSVQ